jgi:hypothetical protein
MDTGSELIHGWVDHRPVQQPLTALTTSSNAVDPRSPHPAGLGSGPWR